MSQGLLKKFIESILEMFSNAVLHSRSELGIFSCGQYFPKRRRLDFSVTDLGIGIRRNVNEVTGQALSPDAAIKWATEGRNTTKRGQIPGGLGLKLLREFIDLNGGCINIVSDAGYWRQEKGKTVTAILKRSFPGTVVSVEINTADNRSYLLSSIIEITYFEVLIMSNNLALYIRIGSQLCIASAMGRGLRAHSRSSEEGRNVTLSFHNVTTLTSAFLNAAIGQIYGTFS